MTENHTSLAFLFPDESSRVAAAERISEQLGISLLSPHQIQAHPPNHYLAFGANGLGLYSGLKLNQGAVQVNFVTGKASHRRVYGGGKGQLLARAIGLHKGVCPTVVDTTAGLGGDAFVLASLGCEVTMLERSALVATLLADGLQRAAECGDSEVRAIVNRMRLLPGNALDYLGGLSATTSPQVIYVDPMYPHTGGSALVKKEMAIFRELLGPDDEGADILQLALRKALNRVVVKRPRLGDLLCGPKPDLQLKGKSSRFDIYTLKGFGKS